MYFEYTHGSKLSYEDVKRDFLRDLTDTFMGFIRSNGRLRGYPEHLLNVFITFDLKIRYELDYELDYLDFRHLNRLSQLYGGWGDKEWMQVFRLFSQTIKFRHRLSPFIRLFFYDLVYMGLFDENIEVLDMPDELLELMGEEMKKLNNLFDEYLISDDSSLVKEIVNISKSDSIPQFAVTYMADRINEHAGVDKGGLGDSICELYVKKKKKILKKPELTAHDKSEISSIYRIVDVSNFTDAQKDHIYSVIGRYKVYEIRKLKNKRRRLPPRYRC